MKNTIQRYGFPHDFTWRRARTLSFWKGVFVCSWLGHRVNEVGHVWCGRCGLYYGEFTDMEHMAEFFSPKDGD